MPIRGVLPELHMLPCATTPRDKSYSVYRCYVGAANLDLMCSTDLYISDLRSNQMQCWFYNFFTSAAIRSVVS